MPIILRILRSFDIYLIYFYILIYTILIYSVVCFGLYDFFKNKNNNNLLLIILLSAAYYYLLLGWYGKTRLFVPILIYLSIFFGNGLVFILDKFYKKK